MLTIWRTGTTAPPSPARLRCSSCSSSSSSTTRERSLRMNRAPFISSSPPMMLVGTPRRMTVSRMPMALVKKAATIPPSEAADEEDVHGGQGRAHAPQPVGDARRTARVRPWRTRTW